MTTDEPATNNRPLTRLGPAAAGGGDPACWLANVCPECGAFNDTPDGAPCWNCGRATASGF